MLRAFQNGGETRHLLEHIPLVLAFELRPSLCQNPLSNLDHDGDDTGRLTAFVRHRRIVEIEPHLFGLARAVQYQHMLAIGQCATGQPDLHDVVVEIRDFRPALAHLGTQQLRMSAASKNRIGVVIEHDAVFVPQHDDGHG